MEGLLRYAGAFFLMGRDASDGRLLLGQDGVTIVALAEYIVEKSCQG